MAPPEAVASPLTTWAELPGSVACRLPANTFPLTFDALGRYVFLRARVGF